jgi:hypothetical protein
MKEEEMNIRKLFGWHEVSKCNPKRDGYFRIIDTDGKRSIAEFCIATNTWLGDLSEFGLNPPALWKEMKETK